MGILAENAFGLHGMELLVHKTGADDMVNGIAGPRQRQHFHGNDRHFITSLLPHQ